MRTIDIGGAALAVDERGEGDPVLLLHGFPELAYSWRHVVPHLAASGFRCIAVDQRGYGSSSKPGDVAAYGLEILAGDVVRLMDALDIDRSTIVGHDWGSIVAYTTAILYPERVDRLVSLNVPYRGACWGFPTTDVIRERYAERYSYVLMFQQPGAAEAGFEASPEGWLNAFYLGGANGRRIHTAEEFAVYVDAFRGGGISGPVNWYRNIDANAARLGHLKDAGIEHPTLVIAADSDPVLPLSGVDGMERWVPALDVVVVENCGHWTQQERPDAVNEALLGWLGA